MEKQSIETQMRPENGYYLDVKGGTTLGKLLSSSSMQRVLGSAGYYFTPENKKIGTFVARGQIGFVNAGESNDVPSPCVSAPAAQPLCAATNSTASASKARPARYCPTAPSPWPAWNTNIRSTEVFSAAIFHDMGDAAHSFKNMTLKHGTGIGVRWFSPVAPFSFDIAYGHQDKRIRWHISLGTRF